MLEDDDLTFDALADEYGIDSSTSSDHFTGHGASLPERNPSPQQSNEILSFGTRNQFSSEPDGGYSSPSPAFFAHTQSPNGQYGLPAQAGETFNFSRLQPGPYLPAFDDFRFGVNVEQDLQAGPVRHNISTVQQADIPFHRDPPLNQHRARYLEEPRALFPPILGNDTNSHRQRGDNPRNQHGIRLKPVSILQDRYRQLFKFPAFNAVQSSVIDSVLHSNRNVVVSAPTGSGKTVIFELAIIRMLMSGDADSKAVYLAPTKALCAERFRDWELRLQPIGCKVVELTGDSGFASLGQAQSANVIISTPEKWDSLSRRWTDHQRILNPLNLFMIDEVHTLHEDTRGPRLEVDVSRMKTFGTKVRFLALSATCPNLEDIGSWIGNADCFVFGEEYRPCPLKKFVYGYPPLGDEFKFLSSLNHKLLGLIKEHAAGKPCLVFVSTRKSASEAAVVLAKEFQKLLEAREPLPWPAPGRVDGRFKDKKLQELASTGVSFHHAGLAQDDRRAVEQAFLQGKIRVLCATTTLAIGVNLPSFCVIIRGTKQFTGSWTEISDLDLIQMLGRAGRPQFDREGVAVIMTEHTSKQKYQSLASGQTIIESKLHRELTEHINAEIGLGTVYDEASAFNWLSSTFLSIRIRKNASYYKLANAQNDVSDPDDILRAICKNALNSLQENAMITRGGDEDQTVASTDLGDILSRYFIQFKTMLRLLKLKEKSGTRELLELLSTAEEFVDVRIRQGEKQVYNELRTNQAVRFPPPKIAGVPDKINLLIQAVLAGLPLQETLKSETASVANPIGDVFIIFRHASRIVKVMMDIALSRSDGGSAKNAFELLRSVNGKAWDASPVTLRQLDGVGEKSIKALAAAGIKSISDVAAANPRQLEMILSRNPPTGDQLKAAAEALPRFTLHVDAVSVQTKTGQPVQIVLSVQVGVVPSSKMRTKVKDTSVPLFLSVLSTSSDSEFFDFRRIPVKKLIETKKFNLICSLTRPSQKIVVTCACDEIAGSAVRATYSPDVEPGAFPMPIFSPAAADQAEQQLLLEGLEDDPSFFEIDNGEMEEPPVHNKSKQYQGRASNERRDTGAKPQTEAVRLANGNFKCGHKCKGDCRHLCCREGLPKPPKAAKRRSSNQSLAPPCTETQTKAPARTRVQQEEELELLSRCDEMIAAAEGRTDAWSASKRRQKSSSAKGADGFAELENIHRKTVTGDVRTKRLQLKRPAKYSQDVWRGVTNDDSSILDETVAPLPSPPAVDTLFSRIMDEDPFDQPTHMATTSHMSPSCEDEPVHNALATENPPAQTDSDSFSDTNLPPNLGPERTNIVQNPRAFHLPFSPSATNAGHAAPETDDARAVMVCAEKPAKRQRVDASENKLNLSIVRQLPASGTSQIETPPAQKSANNGPFRPRFLRKIGAPSWVGSQDATDDVQGSTAMPPAARASTQFGEETPSNSRNNQVDGQTIAGSDARREKLRSTKLFLMSSEDSHRSSYAASVHDGHLHKQRSSSRTQPTSPISAAVGIASAADFNAKPSVDFGKSDQESSNAVQRQPSADDAGESSDFEAWLNDHTVEED